MKKSVVGGQLPVANRLSSFGHQVSVNYKISSLMADR